MNRFFIIASDDATAIVAVVRFSFFLVFISWNIQIFKACWLSFNAQSFHLVLSPECVRFFVHAYFSIIG